MWKYLKYLRDYWLVKKSGLFDADYYTQENPDVRQADIDPLWHFVRIGWKEGRNPSQSFNSNGYLTINPEIKNAGQNPLIDYILNRQIKGQSDRSQPLISVIITSYNQEAYIKQCLDSIIMQEGNFKLEVILGDDDSVDGTRKILQEYVNNFPQIFFLFPRQENLGYSKNYKRCIDACNGNYIAFCDGDDYWTDVNKLQKQLDFLQKHPDFSMCFSAIKLLNQQDQCFSLHEGQQAFTSDRLTSEDDFSDYIIATFSCCFYRSDIISYLPSKIFDNFSADWIFNFCCANLGPIGFIKEVMTVYRIHHDCAWSGMSQDKQYEQGLMLIDDYDSIFDGKYHDYFGEIKNKFKSLLDSKKEIDK